MKYSKITLKSNEVLPFRFIGSTIRGAFGAGLKKIVCINPSRECQGCFAKEGCLYYDFFEKDSPKFALNIDLSGRVEFDLLLFEESALKAPYVISALHKAFKEIGITKERKKIDFELYFNDKLIFDKEFFEFENKALTFNQNRKVNKIFFKTPLRIKENNRFVRDDIKLETILRSINHRKSKLQNRPLTKLEFTPEYKIKKQNFSFVDFGRFSNRQKTKMKFGGLVGEMEFEYIDENSQKLLNFGSLIGVGKQTTFGLGRMEIE